MGHALGATHKCDCNRTTALELNLEYLRRWRLAWLQKFSMLPSPGDRL
jgi:hypothetical protein